MAPKAKCTMVVIFDPKTGIDVKFTGLWSRKMLDMIVSKMYKFHRQYKADLRRKEDGRKREHK